MQKDMSIKKILYCSIAVILIIIFSVYTIEESRNKDELVRNFSFDMALLQAFDSNKTTLIKTLLSSDAQRLFYTIGKNDNPDAFADVCQYITIKNLSLINNANYQGRGSRKVSKNDVVLITGKKKIIDFCQSNTLGDKAHR